MLSKKGGWTLKFPGMAPVTHFLQLFLLRVPQSPCKTSLVGDPAFKYVHQWDASHSNHRMLSKGPFEEDLTAKENEEAEDAEVLRGS